MRAAAVAVSAAAAAPGADGALDLAECRRITTPSYGGEARHVDEGGGWVSWVEWWSQEGTYLDLIVADCAEGQAMRARLRSEGIGPRDWDRRDRGAEAYATYMGRDPALRALSGLADAMGEATRWVEVAPLAVETCGCAALHPGARGGLPPFEMEATAR
jgi:hypothetical protein